jgi:hypothetical protein
LNFEETMSQTSPANGITDPKTWRAVSRADREARAQRLQLPSGANILAVKPEPLDWIISGRIPQTLLSAVLEEEHSGSGRAEKEVSREEILDLASFATRLVKATVVSPPIGDGPEEIRLEDIPIKDRAYIFEWACRALSQAGSGSTQEDLSSTKLERFREE